MSALLDLEAKLGILAHNPCCCVVCAKAARFAKHVLMDVSPSVSELMRMKPGDPGFRDAEAKFHADELARLEDAYKTINSGRCQMVPPPEPPSPPPPQPDYAFPDPEPFRAQIEIYRRQQMGPCYRRARIEPRKTRIPGTFIIK